MVKPTQEVFLVSLCIWTVTVKGLSNPRDLPPKMVFLSMKMALGFQR